MWRKTGVKLEKRKKAKETLLLLAGLGGVCLLYRFSGVGCPIKWAVGVSCAGCGMTRAIFCALRFQFGKAFYYHPLFWMVPICIFLYLAWGRVPKRAGKYLVWAVAACFAGVYVARLLYSDHQVVSIQIEEGMAAKLWRRFTVQ